MSAEKARLAAIKTEIAKGEKRCREALARQQADASASPAVIDAHRQAVEAIQSEIDDLRRRKINLEAGLPEDHGVKISRESGAAPRGKIRATINDEAARSPVTLGLLADFIDGVFAATKAALAERDERIAELEKRDAAMGERLAEIETRGVRYRGVHQRSESYRRGDMVTSDGSLWAATRDTADTPGASEAWQLAVKRGRDGARPGASSGRAEA